MDRYIFPNNIYDHPQNLLAVLGSWWAHNYAGKDQVLNVVRGKAQVEQQTVLDLMELIASLSRFTVPIYHRDNWYPLYLHKSDRNSVEVNPLRYDDAVSYDEEYNYGSPRTEQFHAFPLPADLVDAPLIMNRFTDPTLVLTQNVDYLLQDNTLLFRANPFEDSRVATRSVYTNGKVTDTEALLWIYRGQWDWQHIYRQFGYVLGLKLQSSQGYHDLMNAVYDAIVGGTTARDIRLAMSAMTGVPLVKEENEVVETITSDGKILLIITDKHVYKFGITAAPTVVVGQTVHRGETLTDTLQIHELNRGDIPKNLHALAMGKGFLTTCFYGDLIFENRNIPLIVESDHSSGFTKLSWALGGFPLDVDKFFDDLHTNGVIATQLPVDDCDDSQTVRYPANDCDEVEFVGRRGTLAHLLDRRKNPIGEPKAGNLPATINPLKFLIQNVLRNNAFIVRVKATSAGHDGVGLHNFRFLRKITPPHTAMLLIMDMTTQTDSITIDNFEEQISTFLGTEPLSDTIDPNTLMRDFGPTIRIIHGTCS